VPNGPVGDVKDLICLIPITRAQLPFCHPRREILPDSVRQDEQSAKGGSYDEMMETCCANLRRTLSFRHDSGYKDLFCLMPDLPESFHPGEKGRLCIVFFIDLSWFIPFIKR
jgi:hypothetical protein